MAESETAEPFEASVFTALRWPHIDERESGLTRAFTLSPRLKLDAGSSGPLARFSNLDYLWMFPENLHPAAGLVKR